MQCIGVRPYIEYVFVKKIRYHFVNSKNLTVHIKICVNFVANTKYSHVPKFELNPIEMLNSSTPINNKIKRKQN